VGSDLVRNNTLPKSDAPLATISDGNIVNYNHRFWNLGSCVELVNLWELDKQVGDMCSGNGEEVIKEFQRMEERDNEVMRKYEEGIKKGYL